MEYPNEQKEKLLTIYRVFVVAVMVFLVFPGFLIVSFGILVESLTDEGAPLVHWWHDGLIIIANVIFMFLVVKSACMSLKKKRRNKNKNLKRWAFFQAFLGAFMIGLPLVWLGMFIRAQDLMAYKDLPGFLWLLLFFLILPIVFFSGVLFLSLRYGIFLWQKAVALSRRWAIAGFCSMSVFVPMVLFVPSPAYYTIPNDSMRPSIEAGARTWFWVSPVSIKQPVVNPGDLVLYTVSGCSGTCFEKVLGRVFAVSGDEISAKEGQFVRVNNQPIKRDLVRLYAKKEAYAVSFGLWTETINGRSYATRDAVQVAADSEIMWGWDHWYEHSRKTPGLNHPTTRTVPRGHIFVRADNRMSKKSALIEIDHIIAWRPWQVSKKRK